MLIGAGVHARAAVDPGGKEPRAFAERLARGDVSAEAELAERYRPGLMALLRHRIGDAARAEDLCHDTLRIAIENLRSGALRDPSRLAPYLRGIAANLSRRAHRRSWRQAPLDAVAEPVDPADNPQECLLAAERVRLVRLALQTLAARDRAVLTAFYIDGREKHAVCADLALSPAQFDVIKFRALRRFAHLWESRPASWTEE